MIVNGVREQIKSDFKRKCQDADTRLKQMEPYSQWSNTAEASIRELKKASARQQMWVEIPKKL